MRYILTWALRGSFVREGDEPATRLFVWSYSVGILVCTAARSLSVSAPVLWAQPCVALIWSCLCAMAFGMPELEIAYMQSTSGPHTESSQGAAALRAPPALSNTSLRVRRQPEGSFTAQHPGSAGPQVTAHASFSSPQLPLEPLRCQCRRWQPCSPPPPLALAALAPRCHPAAHAVPAASPAPPATLLLRRPLLELVAVHSLAGTCTRKAGSPLHSWNSRASAGQRAAGTAVGAGVGTGVGTDVDVEDPWISTASGCS